MVYKASGPDGFSLAFFQQCWDIVKEGMMQIFHEFHIHKKFKKSFNATFIAVILKINGVVELKIFRPMNLVGEIYKIISNVFANWLSLVLHWIISKP